MYSSGDSDSGSEREFYSSKRHCHENLSSISDDESNQSLSRSSSLIQFESLERQCQDISNSSPSIFSSFNSLDRPQRNESEKNDVDTEPESEYYRTLKIDRPCEKRSRSRDSLLYNVSTSLGSDSGDSAESADTVDTAKYDSCRSVNNLKTWRSFDGINANGKNKSSENLSEDSGYGEQIFTKNRSTSIPNIAITSCNVKEERQQSKDAGYLEKFRLKNCRVSSGFDAYDCDDAFHGFSANFGVSYHDLSAIDKYERKAKNAASKSEATSSSSWWWRNGGVLNIAPPSASEFDVRRPSKYNARTSSEPELFGANGPCWSTSTQVRVSLIELHETKNSFLEACGRISSVPKDLGLAGQCWNFGENSSVAAKNFDLADIGAADEKRDTPKMERRNFKKRAQNKIFIRLKKRESSSESESDAVPFKREGSYMEAMENMINMSDDEHNPCYRDNMKHSTIAEFDKKILKAISETSVKSIGCSNDAMDLLMNRPQMSLQNRNLNVKSTPNLSENINGGSTSLYKRNSMLEMPRKSSLVNRSTSTSGVSDNDEKTMTPTKSFSGSTSSKGVHFCPVVAEHKWRDKSASTERESSYSLPSTPDGTSTEAREDSPPRIVRPEPRIAERAYVSQPDLQTVPFENSLGTRRTGEFAGTFVPLRPKQSASQPNVRRHSIPPKEEDGCLVRNYVDKDGVEYKHTHLGDVYKAPTTTTTAAGSTHVVNAERVKPVNAMGSVGQVRKEKATGKSGKLGGFFSRIASFRFPSRKNDAQKKKRPAEAAKNLENLTTGQRLATKEDYIYIPLKGPLRVDVDVDANGGDDVPERAECLSAKPPLPKMPPRVVGACVKKQRPETIAQGVAGAPATAPSRRTIDCGGDASPRPMEPMGLIETDLDTEVTVITSGGAHVKTRSLMNLGPDDVQAPHGLLSAPPHPSRPHKSMEFLLDKQNLKVVEVSTFFKTNLHTASTRAIFARNVRNVRIAYKRRL